MKSNKILIAVAILGLPSSMAIAEMKLGNYDLTATPEVGVQLSSGAEKNSAKFTEYTDIRNSVLAGFEVGVSRENGYHLNFNASRIGLNDQSYNIEGGKYGFMKYNLFYDYTPHNVSFNGVAGYDQTAGVIPLIQANRTGVTSVPVMDNNYSTWAGLSPYSLQYKTMGLTGTVSPLEWLDVDYGVNKTTVTGKRVDAVNLGTPGNGVNEFAVPVDTQATTVNLGATRKGKSYVFTVDGTFSDFKNSVKSVDTVVSSAYGTAAASVLYSNQTFTYAPDNTMMKGAMGLTWFDLPFHSKLQAKVGYTQITNTWALPTQAEVYASGGPAQTSPTANYQTLSYQDNAGNAITDFKGNLQYASGNLAFVSEPLHGLETKLYYNYLRKSNTSTQANIRNTANANVDYNKLFWYFKNNAGFNAEYKLPLATKVGASYEYLNINREIDAVNSTTDKILTVEAKNSYLDMLSAKAKYQRLNRSATSAIEVGTVKTTAGWYSQFQRFRSLSAKTQDKIGLEFDVNPISHLDLGLGFNFAQADHDAEGKTVVGTGRDRSKSVNLDISFEKPEWFTVDLYGSAEISDFTLYGWASGGTGGTGATQYDPTGAINSSNYHWTQNSVSTNWVAGMNVTVPVIAEKMTVTVGGELDRGLTNLDTTYDRATPQTTTSTIAAQTQLDGYTKTALKVKTGYKFTKDLSATVGYTYEKLNTNDQGWDDYVAMGKTGSSQYLYLTGWGVPANYEGHTGMITASYTF